MVCKYFSHPIDCLFTLLISSVVQKFFSLLQFCLLFFILLLVLQMLYPKKSLPRLVSRRVLFLCFLLRVSWIQVLLLNVFNPFSVHFCKWYKLWVWFHSFTSECPVIPEPFIEDTVFSPLSTLGSLVKYQLIVYAQVCIWSLNSVPLVYLTAFMLLLYFF